MSLKAAWLDLVNSKNQTNETEEEEGARLKTLFQEAINANSGRHDYFDNPIKQLVTKFPVLGTSGGSGTGYAFSRALEAVTRNKRLTEVYSERQLIALAAAKVMCSKLDYSPKNLSHIHNMCCAIVNTKKPDPPVKFEWF